MKLSKGKRTRSGVGSSKVRRRSVGRGTKQQKRVQSFASSSGRFFFFHSFGGTVDAGSKDCKRFGSRCSVVSKPSGLIKICFSAFAFGLWETNNASGPFNRGTRSLFRCGQGGEGFRPGFRLGGRSSFFTAPGVRFLRV